MTAADANEGVLADTPAPIADVVDIVVPCTPVGAVEDYDALPPQVSRIPSLHNPITASQLIERMDRSGIQISLVPARNYGDFWRLDEHLLADFCAEYPDRLIPTMGINPNDGIAGVRALERAVRDLGFRGAHVYPPWTETDADDPAFYPFYAKLAELDVPIEIECMASKRLPSRAHPMRIERVAADFPELTIIATHTGYPWERELIAVAEPRANVYIGVDTVHPRNWSPDIVTYLRGEGYASQYRDYFPHLPHEKLLFGTNFLSMDAHTAIAGVREYGFDDETIQHVMSKNAYRVFDLG